VWAQYDCSSLHAHIETDVCTLLFRKFISETGVPRKHAVTVAEEPGALGSGVPRKDDRPGEGSRRYEAVRRSDCGWKGYLVVA
jgi:hypothetical protein